MAVHVMNQELQNFIKASRGIGGMLSVQGKNIVFNLSPATRMALSRIERRATEMYIEYSKEIEKLSRSADEETTELKQEVVSLEKKLDAAEKEFGDYDGEHPTVTDVKQMLKDAEKKCGERLDLIPKELEAAHREVDDTIVSFQCPTILVKDLNLDKNDIPTQMITALAPAISDFEDGCDA